MPDIERDYDAIVVGSGITGGLAAKELCERGLRTLVLEAGRDIDPQRDYTEHVPPWDMRFRGLGNRRVIEERQSVQRRSVSFDELSHVFWTDDVDNPYSTPSDKPFDWFRARQVGGKSIIWGRQVYRWSDLDFEANQRDGNGVDWPIRYADIAPWYDHVERFIGVSGERLALPHLPDSVFQPPMDMNVVEAAVRDRLRGHFDSTRKLIIGRVAVLTKQLEGRSPCHYCGPCQRGCVTRSYFSSLTATLPAAKATGRLTLRPYSIAHSVVYDGKSGRASGVRVIDPRTRAEHEFRARVVFLCASALESVRILMNSRSSSFPDGLANGSGTLGLGVMDHIKWGGASGVIPGWEDRQTIGTRPNGILVPRFRNLDRATAQSGFVRGYQFQGGAGRIGWQARARDPGIGAAFKSRLTTLGPWVMSLAGFGETLPRDVNRARLHETLRDAWGIPTLHIDVAWSPNELAIHRDMTESAAEILEAAGARDIVRRTQPSVPGNTNHEMGGARMGRDKRTSVLNAWNQAHEVPNLFVTDGACMSSSACQNPSLTYMALTARAASHAVDALRRREL
ncbi:MAG: GMC family oxidoreductase [Gemmatimonadota bacterium]|nr:GMC family oxidoreductase [Gemmatimonadota bacterium]